MEPVRARISETEKLFNYVFSCACVASYRVVNFTNSFPNFVVTVYRTSCFFLNVDPRNVDVFSANLIHIERVFFLSRE